MRTLLVVCLLLVPGLSLAASPEDSYIAARDHAIAVLKKAGAGAASDRQATRLSAGLEAQLRRLVGPVSLAGFSGPSRMTPDTLSAEDVGFGALDGISVSTKDQSGSVIVSTEGLLRRWLVAHKAWWKDQANPPADPEAAFRSEPFYTQAVSADAAMSIFAPLPIGKPPGADIAVALLGQEAQDNVTEPPGQIAVAVVKAGKVFVAVVDAQTKLPPIAACEAVLKRFKTKSEAALAKYNASGLKDQQSFDASTRLETEGADAYKACWAQKAGGEPAVGKATQQAQALADSLAGG